MDKLKAISITGENQTELEAIRLSIINSAGEEKNTYTLRATNQVGNFSCPDIEAKGLLDFVATKVIYQSVLEEAVDGSRQAIELNLKKIREQVADSTDITEIEKLSKLICINYQTQTIPLFRFVREFDFDSFIPQRSDMCKKCTYKRRCIYYNANTEQAQESITNNSMMEKESENNNI